MHSHMCARGIRQAGAQRGVGQEPGDGVGEQRRVARRHQQPGAAVLDEFRDSSHSCPDHGHARRHRFHHREWQPLLQRWLDVQIKRRLDLIQRETVRGERLPYPRSSLSWFWSSHISVYLTYRYADIRSDMIIPSVP